MAALRINVVVLKICRVFLESPGTKRSGYDVAKITNLSRDAVYDALHKLEANGWMVSEVERMRRRDSAGRAPRRLYMITGDGQTRARDALAGLQLPDRR